MIAWTLRLLSLYLLAAAFAKVRWPYGAEQAIVAAGMSAELAARFVYLGVHFEAVYAVTLFFTARYRLGSVLACVGFVLLGAVQFAMWRAGVDDCGCFGALRINSRIVIGSIVAGCVVGACGLRAPARAMKWRRVGLGTWLAVVTSAAVGLSLLQRVPLPEGGAHAMLATLVKTRSQPALVLVGSWGCCSCLDLYDDLATIASGRHGDDHPPASIVVGVREGDRAARRSGTDSGVANVLLPEQLWWSLVKDSPPRIYLVRGRAVEEIATRDATQLGKILYGE